MTSPSRVVLALLPPLAAGVLRTLAADDPRIRVVGEAPDHGALRALLHRVRADAVILGPAPAAGPPEALQLLAEFPRLTLVTLGPGVRQATVAGLRLHLQRVDDPAPGALLDALRAAALSRVWFPLPDDSGSVGDSLPAREDLDLAERGSGLAVHFAAARTGGSSHAGPFLGFRAAAGRAAAFPALPFAPMPTTAATRAFDRAVRRMLRVLRRRVLPPSTPPRPDPILTVVSVRERTLGFGGHKGVESRAGFVPAALFGGRVEAVVRIEMWDTAPAALIPLATGVQERLRTRRDALSRAGFLRLRLADTTAVEPVGDGTHWRQSIVCDVLFEYEYRDDRDAASLVVRIPVAMEGPHPESLTVTGSLARWDDKDAPPLVVRGPARVGALGTLAYVPGAEPGGSVTLLRTFDGATGPPDAFTDVQDFVDATGGDAPGTRHALLTLSGLQALFGLSADAGTPLRMGDREEDGDPDEYDPRVLALAPALRLGGPADRLEVAHGGAALDEPAVVYLRALPGPPG